MKPLCLIVGLIEFVLRLAVFAAITLTIMPLVVFVFMMDDGGEETGFKAVNNFLTPFCWRFLERQEFGSAKVIPLRKAS